MLNPPRDLGMPVGFKCRKCKDLIAWVGFPANIPRGEDSLRVDEDDPLFTPVETDTWPYDFGPPLPPFDIYCWTVHNATVNDQHADTWLITCKKGDENRVSRARAKRKQQVYADPDRAVAVPIVIV